MVDDWICDYENATRHGHKPKYKYPPYRRNENGQFICPICHQAWYFYGNMLECYYDDISIVREGINEEKCIRKRNRLQAPAGAFEFDGYSPEDQLEREQEPEANAWLDEAYRSHMDDLIRDIDNKRIIKDMESLREEPKIIIDINSRWFHIEL